MKEGKKIMPRCRFETSNACNKEIYSLQIEEALSLHVGTAITTAYAAYVIDTAIYL